MKVFNKNTIFLIIILLIASLAIFTIKNKNNKENKEEDKKGSTTSSVIPLNAQEFEDLAKDNDLFILDVHTPEQTHIPGTDAFVPYDQIKENLDKLPQDKNTPILVYCRSGSMSDQASKELVQLGYTKIYDLTGGTDNYKQSVQKVTLTPKEKDLGIVDYKEGATTSFTLTNYTSSPLTLVKTTSSCGCTKPKAQKDYLNPYESTQIDVVFTPSVHKDDSDIGQLTRTIYIDTDNPNFSQLTAQFSANVIKD